MKSTKPPVFFALVAYIVATGALAEAVPIGPDISVTGSATYDTGFSFVDNASHSGTMTVTIGGGMTTTTYADGIASGANPLMGTLTDTGDGFGITGTAAGSGAVADAEFAIGVDLTMTITNSSPTDIYQVTVGIAFSNAVDSAGTNAYVDSEFTLDQMAAGDPPPGTEVFFTDIKTDTMYGNEVGGNPVAGFGGPISESGSDTLMLTLDPGDSYVIQGDWTMEGGAFDDATSQALLEDFNVQLTIQDVQFIPESSTLVLATLGLLGISYRRRKRV